MGSAVQPLLREGTVITQAEAVTRAFIKPVE